MSITKAWDWSKNTSSKWLIPCMEICYLAERWNSKGFMRFLDLGCGLGRHSVYMAKHGFEVMAVDLSDEAVKHTCEWATKENLDVRTCISDMLHLPFEDNSFDCMMAYNVVYHTDTNGFLGVLKEIRRVLRPKGELFLTLISKNSWLYRHADANKQIDENTFLRDENMAEMNVPHFYVDLADINKLFADFVYVKLPVEWCEYNMENSELHSRHWALLVENGLDL